METFSRHEQLPFRVTNVAFVRQLIFCWLVCHCVWHLSIGNYNAYLDGRFSNIGVGAPMHAMEIRLVACPFRPPISAQLFYDCHSSVV